MLELQPISINALPLYLIWFNDEDIRKHLYYYSSIFLNANNIGHVGLKNIDKKLNSAEIGYVIGDKELWNKGIATWAVSEIIKIAYEQFNITHLEALDVTNPASRRVLEKNGFQKVENNFFKV